jgi:hypothetical protein
VQATVTSRLQQQFSNELAEAKAASKAEIERAANDNAKAIAKAQEEAKTREATVRAEARSQVETELRDQVAEAARSRMIAEQAHAYITETYAGKRENYRPPGASAR